MKEFKGIKFEVNEHGEVYLNDAIGASQEEALFKVVDEFVATLKKGDLRANVDGSPYVDAKTIIDSINKLRYRWHNDSDVALVQGHASEAYFDLMHEARKLRRIHEVNYPQFIDAIYDLGKVSLDERLKRNEERPHYENELLDAKYSIYEFVFDYYMVPAEMKVPTEEQ